MMPPVKDDQDSLDGRNSFLLNTGKTIMDSNQHLQPQSDQHGQQQHSQMHLQQQLQQQQSLQNNGQPATMGLSKAELRKVSCHRSSPNLVQIFFRY